MNQTRIFCLLLLSLGLLAGCEERDEIARPLNNDKKPQRYRDLHLPFSQWGGDTAWGIRRVKFKTFNGASDSAATAVTMGQDNSRSWDVPTESRIIEYQLSDNRSVVFRLYTSPTGVILETRETIGKSTYTGWYNLDSRFDVTQNRQQDMTHSSSTTTRWIELEVGNQTYAEVYCVDLAAIRRLASPANAITQLYFSTEAGLVRMQTLDKKVYDIVN